MAAKHTIHNLRRRALVFLGRRIHHRRQWGRIKGTQCSLLAHTHMHTYPQTRWSMVHTYVSVLPACPTCDAGV